MKLGQALLERKEITSHIKALAGRFNDATVAKKGTEPEENWQHILLEMDMAFENERALAVAINSTNNTTMVDHQPFGPETMMQAIARRDVLKKRAEQLDSLLAHIRSGYHGEGDAVVASFSTVKFRKQVDRVKMELRVVDEAIQQANWNVDLQEVHLQK